MHSRPTIRELLKRLEEAKHALRSRKGRLVNPAKAVGELNALDVGDTEEVWGLILALLDEISPHDYIGGSLLKSRMKSLLKERNCSLFVG